jgi:hypothetical protein
MNVPTVTTTANGKVSDYNGTITIDTSGTVNFEGYIEPFPSFEMYTSTNGDFVGIMIFKCGLPWSYSMKFARSDVCLRQCFYKDLKGNWEALLTQSRLSYR